MSFSDLCQEIPEVDLNSIQVEPYSIFEVLTSVSGVGECWMPATIKIVQSKCNLNLIVIIEEQFYVDFRGLKEDEVVTKQQLRLVSFHKPLEQNAFSIETHTVSSGFSLNKDFDPVPYDPYHMKSHRWDTFTQRFSLLKVDIIRGSDSDEVTLKGLAHHVRTASQILLAIEDYESQMLSMEERTHQI